MSRRLPGAWILQAATEASRLPGPRQGAGRRSDRPEVLRAAATAPDRSVPGARQPSGHRSNGPSRWTARSDVPPGARHRATAPGCTRVVSVGGAAATGLQQAEQLRLVRRLGAVRDVELAEDVRKVELDRLRRHPQAL